MLAYVGTCEGVHVSAGPEVTVWNHLPLLLFHHIHWPTVCEHSLPSQFVLRTPCLHLRGLELQTHPASTRVLGIWTLVLMLAEQELEPLSYLCSPVILN